MIIDIDIDAIVEKMLKSTLYFFKTKSVDGVIDRTGRPFEVLKLQAQLLSILQVGNLMRSQTKHEKALVRATNILAVATSVLALATVVLVIVTLTGS